jgi:hypothetical protein
MCPCAQGPQSVGEKLTVTSILLPVSLGISGILLQGVGSARVVFLARYRSSETRQ